jgi:hypothetical protein
MNSLKTSHPKKKSNPPYQPYLHKKAKFKRRLEVVYCKIKKYLKTSKKSRIFSFSIETNSKMHSAATPDSEYELN